VQKRWLTSKKTVQVILYSTQLVIVISRFDLVFFVPILNFQALSNFHFD
jgi:hypothetical protein